MITNEPLRRANGRTRQGRRVRDLYRAVRDRLGYPTDPVVQADVENKTPLQLKSRILLAGDAKLWVEPASWIA
jgi:hypothetical protein